jgi:hypothetical protein
MHSVNNASRLGWLLVALAMSTAAGQDLEESLRRKPSWEWPDARLLGEMLKSHLDIQREPAGQIQEIHHLWASASQMWQQPEVLDPILAIGAKLDERLARLSEQLQTHEVDVASVSDLAWMDARIPGWLQDNVRLIVGRALTQRELYDEALGLLESVDVKNVADPASLLFYTAVCEHHLLQKEKCVEHLNRLLERETEIPSRYAVTARLMLGDIRPLKEDTLDEVARLMNDVERRLDLGHSGTRVREQEETIVKKLDKMIDQIQQQLQQMLNQQNQKNSGAQQSPAKPMEDSRAAGETGPGDVDKKDIGNTSGWGDLPPAQRQETLQDITRDLPSHYREVIEGYFKRLGTGR